MINLSCADEFFSGHPLQSRYLEFSAAERSAAVTTAARDVAAALQLDTLPDDPGDNIVAAVCEQAIYLLLNVQVLTGAASAGTKSNLSARACGLLAKEMQENSSSGGDTSGGGNTSGGGDTSSSGGNISGGGDLDTGNQTTIKCVNQFRLIRG